MTETIKTGFTERLQPWQAIFGVLTYVIGAFDITEWQTLALCGFLLLGLAFTQRANYKHKEAIKSVVIPWLVERLLETLGEYLGTPAPPSDIEDVVVDNGEKDKLVQDLETQINLLKGEL
jgi:hypothetical protein